MKKILAVDMDAITLNIISSLLTEHTTDFEILTTDKMEEMHDIFKSLSIDVAIMDLNKPSTNDIEILKFIAKNFLKTPLLAMTAFETIEIESAIKSIGSLQYFEKPVDFKELADKVAEVLESSVKGEIHGISLASFLQMSEMEKTSCALKIKTGDKEGRLFMTKGALIAAEAGELTGKEAVYEILSWDSPVIEIEDAEPTKKREISTPLMSLLMEGLRQKDEKSGQIDKSKISAQKARNISIVSSAERIKDIEKTKKAADTQSDLTRTTGTDDNLESMAAQGKITDAGKLLKRKRRTTNVIKVIAGLLVLAALALTWQFMVQPWLTQRAYKQTIASIEEAGNLQSKINIINDFLNSNPKSQHLSELQSIKAGIEREMESRAFDQTIEQAGNLPIDDNYQRKAEAVYSDFLKQYPDSAYREEIEKRIATIPTIIDDADFRALMNIPENEYSKRLAAYQQYLETHPDGDNAAKVEEMITRLGSNIYQHIKIKKETCDKEKKWEPCIKLCQYFIKNFQQHDRLDDVNELQQTMEEQRDLISLTQQAQEEKNVQAIKKLYSQYLSENPEASIRPILEKRIAQINRKQEQETTWENLLAYVKNNNNSIFKRTDRMTQYVNNNPPPAYQKEAKSILAWLTKEKQKELTKIARQKALEEEQKEKQAALEREKAAIRNRMEQSGGRFIEKTPGTITDTKTGLTWCMLDSTVITESCMDYKAAQQYVSNLDTGGFKDWRLPDPSELMVIYNSPQGFPDEGAQWYWTADVFTAAWQKKVHTVVPNPSGTWVKSETPVDECGAVRAVRP